MSDANARTGSLVNQSSQSMSELPVVTGWQGSLQLEFAHVQGKTQLAHCISKAPFKLQRPFYPEGADVCHSVILHTAGGVVGGDRLLLDIHLRPGAQALITTAAAGKIYRSNGLESQQTVRIQVDAGACLEWLPQETIVFNAARYRQTLRVELAPEATWLGWEITRLGRSASGERFLAGNWRSHTEVWQQGRPVWIDPQWLLGSEAMLDSPHGLAGYPVVGSFALIGSPVESTLVEQIRQLWQGEGDVGVTRLQSGLLCRYRGPATSEVRRWFLDVWQLVRLSYRQRPACIPRVWQL